MTIEHLVHYYLPNKVPFQNLSDLSLKERKIVSTELNDRAEKGLMKRTFPNWYFEQRKEAEGNLKKEAIRLGEKPQRDSPHYFSLGQSLGMEFMYNNDFRALVVPVKDIKSNIYFSIGDTLWTFAENKNSDQKWKNKWYQGQLYNYEEALEIINKIKLDLKSSKSLNRNQVFHIEALIWSDEEIQNIIKKYFKN